jgi:subtilisin family serine protease
VRRAPGLALVLVLLMSLFGGAAVTLAADPELSGQRPVSEALEGRRIAGPTVSTDVPRPSVLDASLLSARGTRQVVVRLSEESVSEVAATGGGAGAQRQALAAVTAQQDGFVGEADATVLARTEIAVNTVVLEVDAAELTALAGDPSVISISPVIDYANDLEETVPYIGATAVHDGEPGFDGAGVTVAVLDSGIDYTHAAFGGPGTAAAYNNAYGSNTGDSENKEEPNWNAIDDDTNIVGGFDFVGEDWPFGPLAPDPDPIDCGGKDVHPDIAGLVLCDGGHGTHVADIIGGVAGVAPGVEMHAVKVCSAVSTSCSGVALLLGMDYALDPNADGVTNDRVDVINLSLGSDYGQAFDDDLSQAVENATDLGVLTVAAAGNGSDHPYVSGSPAATPSALSVAQTAVPSAELALLEVVSPAELAGLYEAAHQDWSAELTTLVNAELFFDESTEGRRLGCRLDNDDPETPNPEGENPFEPGELTGHVVLVERGACNFSEKIANIALAGGEIGVIGLVTPEEPFSGALGDCQEDACHGIPGYMIRQAISEDLQAADAAGTVVVEFDPAAGLNLQQTMVSSSSRGPTMLTNIIKPEIGAPGASVSAEVGTATETTPFSGTSGATPMVAGSAALLLEAFEDRSPAEIKSLLMNYAETEIWNAAPEPPIDSPLAAIQRIGAGEVRVDRSVLGGDLAAWDTDAATGALSFGFVDASQDTVLTREVTVANYGGAPQTLSITESFRFGNDAGGAVSISAPASVMVPAATATPGTATFDVTVTINAGALRDWTADSGGNGNNPEPFNLLEYDGYIHLDNGSVDPLHLAWHVLPRQSGEASVADDSVVITGETEGLPSGETTLTNVGENDSVVESYSLIGESSELPTGDAGAGLPTIDLRYAGMATIPVPAGFCFDDPSFILLLSVNTWQRQTHANAPAAFEWQIDINEDAEADYAVFNLEAAGDLSDGRNVVFADQIDGDNDTAFFFTDHATNSANTVLTICAEQIGLTGEDEFAPLTADLLAVDTYFAGRVTDQILGMEFATFGERFIPLIDGGFAAGVVPAESSVELIALDFGVDGTNPSETGMLLFTDGTFQPSPGVLAKTGSPQANEALAVRVTDDLPFDDIAGTKFVDDIVWAFETGITTGCGGGNYCPNEAVTRAQMATFLNRALGLQGTNQDFFTDDENSSHERAINRLAAAGITTGCGGGKYCPNDPVTRAQMATFLDRALDLDHTSEDFFTDDEDSSHERAINRLAASGITTGCTATRFCPNKIVTRGQMAAFLHRAEPLFP